MLAVRWLCLSLCFSLALSTRTHSARPFRALSHPTSRSPLSTDPVSDCAFRSLAIELAGSLRSGNTLSQAYATSRDAWQFDALCNTTPLPTSPSTRKAVPPRTNCSIHYYVDGTRGSDVNNGAITSPFMTIGRAVRVVRSRTSLLLRACISVRSGTYYWNAAALANIDASKKSQVGALQLTAADSNLLIEAYNGENVTFSGGYQISTPWKVYKITDAGTVMGTRIPDDVDITGVPEFFVDGVRAVRAKYPNGDPSTHGLHTSPTGWLPAAASWGLPLPSPPQVDLLVAAPFRNRSDFSNYLEGIGGVANVWDPPRSYWAASSPAGGAQYSVASAVEYDSSMSERVANWSDPATGFVHAMHQFHWGSWIFSIATAITQRNLLIFGQGGFQEARGASVGVEYFISNILEELDDPNEWFLDVNQRMLYYMLNDSRPAPTTYVLSQFPCILSIRGDMRSPATNITISGITFTHTASTFMSSYEVPSGGDWAIHRGGAMFLQGTKSVVITNSLFTQLGGNGLVVSNYNQDATVTHSEFSWIGDSAVIILGRSNGIDGVSCTNQPNYTTVTDSLFREAGIYTKQSAHVFVAYTRHTHITRSVMFNVPRAAININDGFAGGLTVDWNIIFNTVRETRDHGPTNTWDRQPYLTTEFGDGPSLRPYYNQFASNFIYNNYNADWPIDHDDGSCYYVDSGNVLFYGGSKSYLGHSRQDVGQLYIFPHDCCDFFQYGNDLTNSYDEAWYNNECITNNPLSAYLMLNCNTDNLVVPYLAFNTFYTPNSSTPVMVSCTVNSTLEQLDLRQWGVISGDHGTLNKTQPNATVITQWARHKLISGMKPVNESMNEIGL